MHPTLAQVLDAAADLAKPFEGLRLQPYHDVAGFPTIGYGHLLSREQWADLSQWKPITLSFAEQLLEEDMTKAALSALKLCPGAQSIEQFAALADFAFNLGGGCLQRSTLRAAVNRQDYDLAVAKFHLYNKAGGKVVRGLVRRRAAEAELFTAGC